MSSVPATTSSAGLSADADKVGSDKPTATGDLSIAGLMVNGKETAGAPGVSASAVADPQPFNFGAVQMASTITMSLDLMAMATGS